MTLSRIFVPLRQQFVYFRDESLEKWTQYHYDQYLIFQRLMISGTIKSCSKISWLSPHEASSREETSISAPIEASRRAFDGPDCDQTKSYQVILSSPSKLSPNASSKSSVSTSSPSNSASLSITSTPLLPSKSSNSSSLSMPPTPSIASLPKQSLHGSDENLQNLKREIQILRSENDLLRKLFTDKCSQSKRLISKLKVENSQIRSKFHILQETLQKGNSAGTCSN